MKRNRKRKDAWPRKISEGRVTITIFRDRLPSGNWRYRVDNRQLTRRFEPYATEVEAVEAAQRLAKRVESQETNAAKLTDAQAIEYIRALEVLKPFSLTVSGASELLAQALTKLGDVSKLHEAINFYALRHKKITDKVVKVVTDALIEQKKRDKCSIRYTDSLESCYKRFAEAFVCNIGDITTPVLKAWLDGLGFEPQTYVNNRRMLNVLFEYAVECGYAIDNPIERLKTPKLRSKETEIFKADDLSKLLQACDATFLPCVAIQAFAGLRSAEVERLEWSDVDLKRKHIKVQSGVAKTGSRRVVPIHDNLAAWLADYANSKGKVWKDTSPMFYREQRQTAAKAKVTWLQNGLRHSYGSYRLAQVQDDGKVALEMGNSKEMIHRHYKELVTPEEATIYFAVMPEQAANIVSLASKV